MKKYITVSLLVSFLMACMAIGLWNLDIKGVNLMYGDTWKRYSFWSPYFITIFAVVAYILPFGLKYSISKKNLIGCFVSLFIVSEMALVYSESLFKEIYTAFFGGMAVIMFLPLVLGVAALYFFITRQFLMRVRRRQILLTVFMFLASIFLDLFYRIAIDDNKVDFYHIVGRGSPFFFVVLLMGINGVISCAYLDKESDKKKYDEDILDAPIFD